MRRTGISDPRSSGLNGNRGAESTRGLSSGGSRSIAGLPGTVLPGTVLLGAVLLGAFLFGAVVAPSAKAVDAAGERNRTSEPAPPESEAFFERHVRPLLIEHCQECHASETESSGGLNLDSRTGWSEGGDLGPAIIPGDPDGSLLIRAVEYRDPDLQMPPEGKLPDEAIAALRRWVQDGAFDPREGTAQARPASGLPVERAQEHWSFRPLSPTAGSAPTGTGGAKEASSRIDAWIDEKLAESGIEPAPPADRRELLRRLSFDLLGLPPTVEETLAFQRDRSPDSLARAVERLLASPHYGERFARHWMDVARYAESITLRGFVLPEAWRYRDYLIMAYATDRPFDQMIREQLAGDQIPYPSLEDRQWGSIATGFLAMGNTNLEDQDKLNLDFDYIDEQLETIGRAFLGQTIGCARCHDHKFDPIPTSDYYAMAAILRSTVAMEHANVSKWIERPLPLEQAEVERYAAIEQELAGIVGELKRLDAASSTKKPDRPKSIPLKDLPGIVVDDPKATFVGTWESSSFTPGFVAGNYRHDMNTGQGTKTVTFEPQGLETGNYEVRVSYTPGRNRATKVRYQVFSAIESTTVVVNQRQDPPIDGIWISLGEFPFEKDGQAYVMISNEGADGHVIADAVQFLPAGGQDPARPASAVPVAGVESSPQAEAETKQRETRRKALVARQKELESQLARRPKYLTVVEAEPVKELEIRIRGNVHSLGPKVERGFLTAVGPCEEFEARIPDDRSGRLVLADWLVSPENPLTPRVYANRVWSWLMGEGLVATENNFGTTGNSPSHPEILDFLASELIRSGWSTKHLVRIIVNTRAYQRAFLGEANSPAASIDPDNRLYWSGNLKRLPVESIRDTMLVVSGELDRRIGGSDIRPGTSADYDYRHGTQRRSVYAPVFRNALPPLFTVFDFADTSVSVGQRARSTVATQSLAMINNPWVIERSREAAKRYAEAWTHAEANERGHILRQLYLECLGREPEPEETELLLATLADKNFGAPTEPSATHATTQAAIQARLELLVQALFASIDFRFLE